MANHQSAKKRIRQNAVRRERNRLYHVTMRNALKQIRETENKDEAEKMLPGMFSKIDRLARRNVIHKNKAANLKSKVSKHVASLS